jgi:outer membrane protein assembly factor BamB
MLPLILALLLAPLAAAAPIPEGPDSDPPPAFAGDPWTPRPVFAPPAPRHPFMAPNQRSNIHSDAFQTDTNAWSGPLGRDTETISHYEAPGGVCGSITFNSQNQIVTTCLQARAVRLKLFDAQTLEELASMELPPRALSTNPFQDFAGGGYFYLDNRDRAVIPTTERHILVVGIENGQFAVEKDHDLTGTLPEGSKIISALPDWSGRIWLATTAGIVAVVNPATGAVKAHDLGEVVQNSFAVGERGDLYIVSEQALYRFAADRSGAPVVRWRKVYENTGEQKPGQVSAGSGTTPTLHGDGWVSITDNADPMNVVVYRRSTGREICRQAVFEKGSGSTDNSLIGAGHSIVVENNHGYTGPTATTEGARTKPGIERVDIDADGVGCRRVWRSDEISPSLVPKLSLANGLVYVYTQDPEGDSDDPWFLTALDFRTGRTVWKRLTGQGISFNNNYAPVTIGPDGTAYVGVLGGLLLVRDRSAPVPPAETRPRIRLRAKRRGGRVAFRATAPSGGVVAPVRGALVRAGGRRARTNGRGRVTIRVAKGRAVARKTGYRRGTARVPR